MTYVHSTRATSPSFGERLSAWLKDRKEGRARRALYLRTRNELDALSNRDLADLGIHRSMIESIAHEAAYGK